MPKPEITDEQMRVNDLVDDLQQRYPDVVFTFWTRTELDERLRDRLDDEAEPYQPMDDGRWRWVSDAVADRVYVAVSSAGVLDEVLEAAVLA